MLYATIETNCRKHFEFIAIYTFDIAPSGAKQSPTSDNRDVAVTITKT